MADQNTPPLSGKRKIHAFPIIDDSLETEKASASKTRPIGKMRVKDVVRGSNVHSDKSSKNQSDAASSASAAPAPVITPSTASIPDVGHCHNILDLDSDGSFQVVGQNGVVTTEKEEARSVDEEAYGPMIESRPPTPSPKN